MTSLQEALGFDPNAPEARRSQLLARNDRALLRELVNIRKERGISQQAVGDIMGISQPSVAAFEAHDANPKLSTIRRYAHAVGALIRHTVALDEGQLGRANGERIWRTARLDATIESSPEAAVVSSFRGATSSHAERPRHTQERRHADFALAA